MEQKEIKIVPPDGMEIDKENSTFDCIRFKPIVKRWRDSDPCVSGYYLYGNEVDGCFLPDIRWMNDNLNLFATEKQAKSALAMAQISQIIANDPRFGGVVTDEERSDINTLKFSINRNCCKIKKYFGTHGIDHFLSFHTAEQRDLFLEENEDLVKDYLMID